jgi:hypothetical protein
MFGVIQLNDACPFFVDMQLVRRVLMALVMLLGVVDSYGRVQVYAEGYRPDIDFEDLLTTVVSCRIHPDHPFPAFLCHVRRMPCDRQS